MSTPDVVRQVIATPDADGKPTAHWRLTDASITDDVKIHIRPIVLPVIFVPGIMGSNLREKGSGKPIWRLDVTPLVGEPAVFALKMGKKDAAERQIALNPATVEVDPGGAVPSTTHTLGGNVEEQLRARGWGEVSESSYRKFLYWLENTLNPTDLNPAKWSDYHLGEAIPTAPTQPGDKPKLHPHMKMRMEGEPGGLKPEQVLMSDDLLKRSKCWMPVHACGYNWLASNKEAAQLLAKRIDAVIGQYNKGMYSCSQVILVTHSMGGLVARACSQLPGMADKIAGIVHGVMPTVGAAVAYRRCKIGMKDEAPLAGMVIGNTGPEVTAVFAQAPGALQLLPTQDYTAHGKKEWLTLREGHNTLGSWPKQNPYDDIYLERNKWWGLINEAWLAPKGGTGLKWRDYKNNLKKAREFHAELSCKYHPSTYVLYGADAKQPSFEGIVWQARKGIKSTDSQNIPSSQLSSLSFNKLRADGNNPEYVGGERQPADLSSRTATNLNYGLVYEQELSDWELYCEKQDGAGDGTVPVSSGCAPEQQTPGSIKLQRGLTGFGHEPAYQDHAMQRHTLFCINKIAGHAQLPA